MTGRLSRRVDFGAVLRAAWAALQWRLLLLWLLLLLLPTAVVSLPLWRALAAVLDHSVHAQAWAGQFNALMYSDTIATLMSGGMPWLSATMLLGLLLTVLLSPFLNGMAVGSALAGRVLGFSHLLQCGIVEYGRMFRVMLWSLLPYAVMAALAGFGFHLADKVAEHAVLESKADAASLAAWGLLGALWVLAQAVVTAMRAAFIADSGLRSATRAFGRGFMQLLRRPFSTLLCYLLISAAGYAGALMPGLARVQTPALGVVGLVLAILLTQLVALVLGWTHIARMYALAEVARSLPSMRRGGGLPAAL